MRWPVRVGVMMILSSMAFAGCRSSLPTPSPTVQSQNDLTNSVAWMQTSAEATALRIQVFRDATEALDRALEDTTWTAADEQTGDFASLPPAVIVDVDETVLDNSPLEARYVRRNEVFTPESWREWVEERQARPLAGALAFARHASERGVTIFYVTNRDIEEEPATRENLERVGFPLAEGVDVVLTRGENGATSDKASRRTIVASTHRILLMLGDDLGDFTSREGGIADRFARVDANEHRWGTRWFVLPNPMYGSWERAITVSGASSKTEALDESLP